MIYLGLIKNLSSRIDSDERTVLYDFILDKGDISVNGIIGQRIAIEFTGNISCVECGRSIKKTFNQGYCFPCFKSLPQNDVCIVKPELCHFDKGTCRDSSWGEKKCFIPHTIYLAISSGIKVGITRSYRVVSRWVDQGAVQALPIAQTFSRRDAGQIEVALKEHVADKTNWRSMLKGIDPDSFDLNLKRDELFQYFPEHVQHIKLQSEKTREFVYPVPLPPKKIKSFSFDKTPSLLDTLIGVKGRYLIFETCVVNMSKYSGYELKLLLM